MKLFIASVALFVGACSAGSLAPPTGDPLIDQLVSFEGSNTPCVTFRPAGHVAKPDPEGPPAMMTADIFKDSLARQAAETIAVTWKDISEAEPETVGKPAGDRCLMRVSGPAFSDNYAFMSFSDPDGEIGAYAFSKSGNGWKVVEKVRLGFWWIATFPTVRFPPQNRTYSSAFG